MDGIRNPVTPTYSLSTILAGIVTWFILGAAFLAFIYLISGGILWMSSGGDKTQIETARNRMVQALVGLVVVASVWAIINLLFPVLGLSFSTLSLPSIGRGLSF